MNTISRQISTIGSAIVSKLDKAVESGDVAVKSLNARFKTLYGTAQPKRRWDGLQQNLKKTKDSLMDSFKNVVGPVLDDVTDFFSAKSDRSTSSVGTQPLPAVRTQPTEKQEVAIAAAALAQPTTPPAGPPPELPAVATAEVKPAVVEMPKVAGSPNPQKSARDLLVRHQRYGEPGSSKDIHDVVTNRLMEALKDQDATAQQFTFAKLAVLDDALTIATNQDVVLAEPATPKQKDALELLGLGGNTKPTVTEVSEAFRAKVDQHQMKAGERPTIEQFKARSDAVKLLNEARATLLGTPISYRHTSFDDRFRRSA